MKLKKQKDFKKINLIMTILLFIFISSFTFNYLNKNIYKTNTKEYINFYSKLSFDTKNNLNIIMNKIFNIYDNFTNDGFKYE